MNSLAMLLFVALQDPSPVTVKTKSGRTAPVQVLELVDGKAKLKVFALGGEITLTRDLDVFTPESAFMIEERAAAPKTMEQHLALAKRAADLHLLPQAGNQARLAVKAAGTGPDAEAKKEQVHKWAADALEKTIGEAVAEGDLELASRCLELLTTRLPEQRTEQQLATLADMVGSLRDQNSAKNAAERQSKMAADKVAAFEKKLEPIRSKAKVGDKEYAKAVAQTKKTNEAAKLCESAIGNYKSAWKSAEELAKSDSNDAAMQEEIAALSEEIADNGIRAALHGANCLILQSDYKGATEWANKILKFDPENEDAKELLQTIQVAQAAAGNRDDYRYGGWRRGRR